MSKCQLPQCGKQAKSFTDGFFPIVLYNHHPNLYSEIRCQRTNASQEAVLPISQECYLNLVARNPGSPLADSLTLGKLLKYSIFSPVEQK